MQFWSKWIGFSHYWKAQMCTWQRGMFSFVFLISLIGQWELTSHRISPLRFMREVTQLVILYFKWPHYIWNIGVSTMLPRAVHRRRRLLPPRCPLCIISAAKDSAQSRTTGYYWIKELYWILHNPHVCGRPIFTWTNCLLKQFYKFIH